MTDLDSRLHEAIAERERRARGARPPDVNAIRAAARRQRAELMSGAVLLGCLIAVAITVGVPLAQQPAVLPAGGGQPTTSVRAPADPTATPRPAVSDRPSSVPSTIIPPSLDADDDLTRTYRECVRSAGFDPDIVEVLTAPDGTPWAVKSGVDVPAEFHRPCFMQIGGADPRGSSYGN